jgi:hypothetical protein
MAYYIDKGSIRIEPTQDPSIFQVTADVTTDKTGNDWEKEWTTVTCKVNKNETGSLAKYIEKAYKAKKEIPEQTAIDTLLSRLSQEKTVSSFTRENPSPPPSNEDPPMKVEIVGLKEGVVLKMESVTTAKEV